MLRYMERRGYSPSTIRAYTMWVLQIALHYDKSPDLLTEEEIGAYFDHLRRSRQLSQSSLAGCYSGIKLLWEKVLGRSWNANKLPRSKRAKTLPEVLSEEEVRQLICQTKNLKHRAFLKVLYTTGVRVGELVKLKPGDIDSKRMVVRVEMGKGKKSRYTVLSMPLLKELRAYWLEYRPRVYLFEGAVPGRHISIRTVQTVFKQACKRIGLRKQVGVHVLRHPVLRDGTTHLLENGVDTLTVKALLGHSDISTTARYVHVQNSRMKGLPDLLAHW